VCTNIAKTEVLALRQRHYAIAQDVVRQLMCESPNLAPESRFKGVNLQRPNVECPKTLDGFETE
jgi:hypothetical protein